MQIVVLNSCISWDGSAQPASTAESPAAANEGSAAGGGAAGGGAAGGGAAGAAVELAGPGAVEDSEWM